MNVNSLDDNLKSNQEDEENRKTEKKTIKYNDDIKDEESDWKVTSKTSHSKTKKSSKEKVKWTKNETNYLVYGYLIY